MALLSTITCDTCGDQKPVWHSPNDFPTTCDGCIAFSKNTAKEAHLDELAALSLEERLRRIEEWIYEHSRNHPQREIRF